MRALPLIALLPLTACTPPVAEVPADRVPAAQVAGPALSCIDTQRIRNTRVHGNRTIDFQMVGKETYRNTLPYTCPELGFEERFAYSLAIPRLCSTDIVTVLHSDGSRGASCGLGEFVPVTMDPRDRP